MCFRRLCPRSWGADTGTGGGGERKGATCKRQEQCSERERRLARPAGGGQGPPDVHAEGSPRRGSGRGGKRRNGGEERTERCSYCRRQPRTGQKWSCSGPGFSFPPPPGPPGCGAAPAGLDAIRRRAGRAAAASERGACGGIGGQRSKEGALGVRLAGPRAKMTPEASREESLPPGARKQPHFCSSQSAQGERPATR